MEIEQGVLVQLAPLGDVPPSVEPQPRVFRFKSIDGKTTASLASSFYALSTLSYSHWKDFVHLLQFVSEVARAVYDIPYATRIGLRYINNLTLTNTASRNARELWDVLRPELAALLEVDCWDEPIEALNQLLLAAEGDEKLMLRVGHKRDPSPVATLDYDCYTEGTLSLDELVGFCERFHDVIYRAFRWSIRDGKLAVFQPLSLRAEE